MTPKPIILALLAFPLALAAAPAPTLAEAQAFMDRAEAELLKLGTLQQRAGWVQETYITDDTELLAASENERVIARTTELIDEGKRFESLNLPPDLKRKFLLLKLSLTMPAPKDAKLREELTQVAASLDGSYGKGKYCPGGDKEPCLGIDDLDERLAKSRDPKEITELLGRLAQSRRADARPLRPFRRALESGRARTGIRRHRRALARRLRHDARAVFRRTGTRLERSRAALSRNCTPTFAAS